jgi:two-component system LytT family response regulator
MNAYLVDDEPIALRRLERLLREDNRIHVLGSATDPHRALRDLQRCLPDILFLDIEMPGMSGFELLEKLKEPQPLIVFTTAYDQYALHAFKVNSIDYLLKPIGADQLGRAVAKIERMVTNHARGDVAALLKQMRTTIGSAKPAYPSRLASRNGDRVEFIDVASITHFFARDKVTIAATPQKEYILDLSISELEQKLSAEEWVRIHRSLLVNIIAVKEMRASFGGRVVLKLKDGKTQLQVARDRVAHVKAKLSL